MKIQVFNENEKYEKTVYLRLVPSSLRGGVDLCAVDSRGNTVSDGIVLTIRWDGKLRPQRGLNPNIGLSVVNSFIEILPPLQY
jgi:hypothetical protein